MTIYLEMGGQQRKVRLERDAEERYRVWLDGEPVEADAQLLRPGVLSLILDGRAHRVVLEEAVEETAVHVGRERFAYRVNDPRSLRSRRRGSESGDGPATLKASMPGRVVRVVHAQGDAVAVGQGVLVIEAMKMQNEVKSPKDGTVMQLMVAAGDTVSAGQVLAVIE
jgi:biotin carboxyl carrier protein